MSFKSLMFLLVVGISGYVYLNYFGEKPDSFIADATLTTDVTGKNLAVDFTTPIRIVDHFPANYGSIVQIRIRSLSFSDFNDNYSLLGIITKSGSESDALIDDVRYEGDVPGGPFIIVKFNKAVRYTVKKGDGLSSLRIHFKS